MSQTIKTVKVIKKSSDKTYTIMLRIALPRNKQRLKQWRNKTYLMHDPTNSSIIGSNVQVFVKKASKCVNLYKVLTK